MGFFLLLPFFLVRFGLLSLLSKQAVHRAAFFAPLLDNEKTAYYLYQISNVAILAILLFLKIKLSPTWLLYVGAAVYLAGTTLLIMSVTSFCAPAESGINQNGIYRLSRNPMYVAYFVFFCRVCVANTVVSPVGVHISFSSHGALDNPFGGKMVFREIRRSVPPIHGERPSVYLKGKKARGCRKIAAASGFL